MVKIRLTILTFAALMGLFVAGCGGSSSGDAGGSASELANLAAPRSLVFVEGDLKPTGELKSNVDSVTKTLTGEASLGAYVASKLESSASEDGQSLDYASEVEPWLGDLGAVAFEKVVGGELSEPLIAVQTTNAKAAQAFVDKKSSEGKEPAKDASYEGVDFRVGGSEGKAVGLIGKTLVLADSEKEFKAAIDASQGDSLGGEDRFQQTLELASNGSFADAYIDVGGIIKQSENESAAPTKEALQSAGIDPSEATAVASVIPHSDQLEIDISSELGGEKAPSGNASKLLGSLPATAFAALSFADFDEQLEEAIDNLDEGGVSPELESGELKSALGQAGIDIEKVASSLEEGAIFAEGSDKASFGAAMVMTAKSDEAAKAVGSLGTLLRSASIPGITAISGKASGFSIRKGEFGDNDIVVIGKGDRIAIGYGLSQALAGLNAGSGATLAGTPGYKAAVAALGKTPISGFVDGPAALKLAETLIPRSESDFWEVAPYLRKIGYIGIGRGVSDELATAKLIAGIGK